MADLTKLYEPREQWGDDEDDDGGGGQGFVLDVERMHAPWRETEAEVMADAEAHRAAVVADSPELAAARERIASLEGTPEVAALRAERDMYRSTLVEIRDESSDPKAFGTAMRALLKSKAIPGEVAALRARVAELEAERTEVFDWCREMMSLADNQMSELTYAAVLEHFDQSHPPLTQWPPTLKNERDAALARVAELEAANEDLRRWVAQHEDERAAVTRALKDATDAAGTTSMHGQGAAQPKPRDESVPPPGWVESDRGPGHAYCPDMQATLAEAWRIYDVEHGYAPPDEAARNAEDMAQRDKFERHIRADERARTERDIAAELRGQASVPGGSSVPDFARCFADEVEASEYPRTGAPAPEPADDSS